MGIDDSIVGEKGQNTYNLSSPDTGKKITMSEDELRLQMVPNVTRRLAALDPAPSVAMDALPIFLSFLFFLILGRIAHAFWRRSRDEAEPKRTRPRPREAAISGSPDPTPWRIQIHR